jgi:N-acyl-D-amino-acid deacylase
VIVNAVVLDGSGAPPRRASVRIVGDRIAEVGHLEASPRDSRVDADGLSLAPGFIDTHSHADADLAEHPAALVYEDGRTTGRRPGRVIRRPPSAKGS